MNEQQGRDRLGSLVRADRVRLYRTVDRARIAAKISRAAWDSVEAGRSVKDLTLSSVEAALNWPAGRAARIISGEDDGSASPTGATSSQVRQVVIDAELPAHIKGAMLALLDSADDPTPASGAQDRGTA